MLTQLIPLCADADPSCRKFASFALGNSAFHSAALYDELAPAIPELLRLLGDEDEKTRANAAGALGNLVRNSPELCGAMIREGALRGLFDLVDLRLPRGSQPAAIELFVADSSVKIALFSLGNLAVHAECRETLTAAMPTVELCSDLTATCTRDELIHRYAQRLRQKLGG